MDRVIHIVSKIFSAIFVTPSFSSDQATIFGRLIRIISGSNYLLFGLIFVVIGASVGFLKRIIHN